MNRGPQILDLGATNAALIMLDRHCAACRWRLSLVCASPCSDAVAFPCPREGKNRDQGLERFAYQVFLRIVYIYIYIYMHCTYIYIYICICIFVAWIYGARGPGPFFLYEFMYGFYHHFNNLRVKHSLSINYFPIPISSIFLRFK